jgi:hypothetical protein
MATIPLQLAQRRLDTGNVVSYSGGSPVGAAMQGFGDELTAVAERYRQQKEQQEAFDAEIMRRQFDGQIAQAENDATQNAPADGSGLHDTMYGQVDLRTGQVVKPGLFDTLFDGILPKIPESQRANFIKQKEALRAAGSTRMATRQQARRDEYELAEWSKVDNFYTGSIAQSDPSDTGTFEVIRQSGHDLIAKIGNPAARQAAEAAWRSNTAKALVQAMIAQDPKRAAEMLGTGQGATDGRTKDDTVEAVDGPPASGSGVLASRDALSGGLPPDERPVRGDSVQSDGQAVWAAAPWIAELSPDDVQDLGQKAQVAMTAQLFDARTNIDLAYQNAPDALMYTGDYSGEVPGPDDFTAVYGAEEGGKQLQGLNRTFDAGRQAFGMLGMPNDAIEAKVAAAKPKPGSATPEMDQAQFEITASAATQVLQARAAAPSDFARKVDPSLDTAWNEVSKPDSYDPAAYQKAIARSVAVQQQLGIKNIQPLPQSVVKNLLDTFLDLDGSQSGKDAALSRLFAGTSDPSVLAAISGQLARAGLSRLLRGTALELPMTPAEMQAHEAELAVMAQNPPAFGELSKYDQTLRDKVAAWAIGDNKASSAWGKVVQGALGSRGAGGNDSSLVDFMPLVGALFSAQEAKRAFENGNYGEAALDSLGIVPTGLWGAAVKRAGKLAKPLEEVLSEGANLHSGVSDFPRRPADTNLDIVSDDLAPPISTGKAEEIKRPYSNLKDPPTVGPGKKPTKAQRAKIYEQNRKLRGGVLRSDRSGKELMVGKQSKKGVTPPENEAHLDHIDPVVPRDPIKVPGSNSYSNFQVLSRGENIEKSNK